MSRPTVLQSFPASPKYNLKFFLSSAGCFRTQRGPAASSDLLSSLSLPQNPKGLCFSLIQAPKPWPLWSPDFTGLIPSHFILASFSKFIEVFCVCVCVCVCVCAPFLKSLLNLLRYCFFSCFGFLAPRHCGIFAPTAKDGTLAPCLGRQNLNHWTTGDVLLILL